MPRHDICRKQIELVSQGFFWYWCLFCLPLHPLQWYPVGRNQKSWQKWCHDTSPSFFHMWVWHCTNERDTIFIAMPSSHSLSYPDAFLSLLQQEALEFVFFFAVPTNVKTTSLFSWVPLRELNPVCARLKWAASQNPLLSHLSLNCQFLLNWIEYITFSIDVLLCMLISE